MKIIHCADLHLDSDMRTHLTREQARERKNELLAGFVRMVDYASDIGAEAVLIAGDLFDTARISAQARNTVYETIRAHGGIRFFYVTGNHERDGFLSAIPKIPANLYTFGDGSGWVSYDLGGVRVTGAELTPGNAHTIWASLAPDPRRFNIVLLHGQTGSYASKDRAETIGLDTLRNKNIDYLALGHIHSYRTGKLPPRGIWCYPGCLMPRGFDETGEHGFVLLDIDPEAHTMTYRFVTLPGRRFYEVPVDVTGIRNTMQASGLAGAELDAREAAGELSSSDGVKIVLTGRVDMDAELHAEQLKVRFADRFYTLQVSDETTLAVNDADYALDPSLKGEFVRTVQADRTLSPEQKAEIIRCGILALRDTKELDG